jgi:hypothetical protein
MVGVNEDFVAMGKRQEDTHGLTEFERRVIGQPVRIEIPFGSKYQMRQIADILRGLAERMDFHSRRTDLPAWEILSHLKNEAKAAHLRIREVVERTGKGRAPKPYRERDA